MACWLAALAGSGALAAPAFPGAEGFGALTPGGRGGTVYHVTTTNDSGPGSLRTGVSVGNRTIVFDVSGTIWLATDLKITRPNITIAGQTAPGDGITLSRRLTSVQDTHDVIVRFIRTRAGDADCPNFQDDSFHVVNGTNIIIDHVSSSWSIDECLSVTWSTNVTVQWCMISESLRNSCHVKGAHGYGSLLRYGNGGLTFHHNLYQHHTSRNPRPGDNMHVDFVNNVLYNWGGTCGYNAEDSADNPAGYTNVLNYVGNYFIAGPSTTGHQTVAFDSGTLGAANCEIYQSGNFIDSNFNSLLDGANTGWSMFGSPYTQRASPFAAPPVSTDSARNGYQRVIAFAGASAVRDAVDDRLIAHVRNHTGAIIDSQAEVGGWPTLISLPPAPDSDGDGIPNYFERTLGWNPSVANNNHTNSDGYTDLEWYLNWLADPHALGGVGTPIQVNLRRLTGGNTNLVFTVANGSNGTAALLGDGYTAQFQPAAGFAGMASCSFTATNAVDQGGFGPVNIAVLVTNVAPVITLQPAGQTNSVGDTIAFNVAANGAGLSYRWRKGTTNLVDGGNVSGAATSSLMLTNVAMSDAANYSVVITNSVGSTTSSNAPLVVMAPAPASPQLLSPAFSNGLFTFSVSGVAGPDYLVQASTNLVDWENVFTNFSPAPPFLWTDGETNFDRRFYRVRIVP